MIVKRINSFIARMLISVVRIYQGTLSKFIGGRCRFLPSCSEYLILAVDKYGPWRGTLKGLGRILRCHPFGKGGIDFP